MTASPGTGRSLGAGACWAFAAIVLAVNLLLLNHDFTVDGLAWARAVDEGSGLFHSNHLLFNALHWTWIRPAQWLGLVGDKSIWAIQIVNVAAGTACAVLVARMASARIGALTAISLGVFTMAGFAFWAFSQEPEVYILPGLLVVLSMALLHDRERLSPKLALVLAGLATLAILLLQQYVLWYPALLGLAHRRLPASPRERRRVWAILVLLPPLACLGVYLLVALAVGQALDLHGLLSWFLGYGYQPEVGLATYREAPALGHRLVSLLLGVANLLFAYEVVIAGWSLVVAALLALLLLLAVIPAWRPLRDSLRGDSGWLWLFAGLNLLFAFWWEARNIEFLLPVWIALVLALALRAARLRPATWLPAVAGLLALNALVAMVPQRTLPERYQSAAALASLQPLRAGDRLITEELNTVRWLNYFHEVPVGFIPGAVSIKTHAQIDLAEVLVRIDAALASGARVYTTELDEHGRLRAIAQRLALVGRVHGQSVADILHDLYSRYETRAVPEIAGVHRLCLRNGVADHVFSWPDRVVVDPCDPP